MTHPDRTRLSVNVNKVALLRNSRAGTRPGPLRFAQIAVDAGAHGVTVHPRPDERHIRKADVLEIADWLGPRDAPGGRSVEFNIEGNPFEGHFLELVEATRPDQATLVPDTPGQNTSDHGWPLAPGFDIAPLCDVVAKIQSWGCRVSLFMDADNATIARVPQTHAERIELYTEPYADAGKSGDTTRIEAELQRFADASETASALGLAVNAGHDLDLNNLAPFLAAVPHVVEVSIGHALIADALELGMAEAVRRYLAIVRP